MLGLKSPDGGALSRGAKGIWGREYLYFRFAEGPVGSTPVLYKCHKSGAVYMLLDLQLLLAVRAMGAGEVASGSPPSARMEKFGGRDATYVGKPGHAGSGVSGSCLWVVEK